MPELWIVVVSLGINRESVNLQQDVMLLNDLLPMVGACWNIRNHNSSRFARQFQPVKHLGIKGRLPVKMKKAQAMISFFLPCLQYAADKRGWDHRAIAAILGRDHPRQMAVRCDRLTPTRALNIGPYLQENMIDVAQLTLAHGKLRKL